MNITEAREALDRLIRKSRIHFYKPIDEISSELFGRVCTSSSRFQDNLFDQNAIPPEVLQVLGSVNRETGGSIEAYIYGRFMDRHSQLRQALDYCNSSSPGTFSVKKFIDSFRNEPGLKRSLDKVYEIIVYALFSALAEAVNLRVEVSADESKSGILSEFGDFAEKVMRLTPDCLSRSEPARIYRAGTTNAADRGIDIYSSWGAVIQVKHLRLDEELAEDIAGNISSDRVIIVCRDADKGIILSLLTQIGWRSHIQSIITEDELVSWYGKALRGKYSDMTGEKLLSYLRSEIANEFPATDNIPRILKSRQYKGV
ncbi:MAG: HaeII family restriction endonuclease [Synergistaceae bacterium]|nr:HaeII family restriction endonuclease [Synergistaceae bacterium]MBQ6972320.1 HaeII family restriction endonuclease [Synergistaceae bacterium]